jgi:hypothetical protein
MKDDPDRAGHERRGQPPQRSIAIEAIVDLERAAECDGADGEADDRQVEFAVSAVGSMRSRLQ